MRKLILILIALSLKTVISQVPDSLTIPYTIIDSDPQNAEVYVNDVFAGHTPYRFMPKDSATISLRIKLAGYNDYAFTYSMQDGNKSVKLFPKSGMITRKSLIDPNGIHLFNKPRKVFPLLLTALISVASGTAAYYYREKSIDESDNFNIYGDVSALDRKKKDDLIGGISLGVFQIAFTAFIYYFFSNN